MTRAEPAAALAAGSAPLHALPHLAH